MKSDLKKIKEIAKMFLKLPISKTQIPFVVQHPFTNNLYVPLKNDNGDIDLVNLDENFDEWVNYLELKIDEADLMDLFFMMNKAYILNFLKYTSEYMSSEDLGKVLKCFWSSIEYISTDNSINRKDIIEWFKKSGRNTMSPSELKVYDSLPNEVTIYRGVTSYNKENKHALSWSLDESVAAWFSKRFQTGTGEVWKRVVPKEKILCYIEVRNEAEVIVSL